MNFLDKPFYNGDQSMIPPYALYGYDNSEELDKDVDYMKALYSKALKRIQQEIDEECDKLEYSGSCMFDVFPDQVHLGTIIDRIYNRMQDMDWEMNWNMQAEQLGNPGYGRPPQPPVPCRGNNCPPPPPRPCRGSNCPPPPPPRPSRPPQPPKPDYRPDGNPDWLRDLIASLLYNEMIHRRRRYRSRNRWNNR